MIAKWSPKWKVVGKGYSLELVLWTTLNLLFKRKKGISKNLYDRPARTIVKMVIVIKITTDATSFDR